ncbi:hypothetical protein [Winogradskyella jejuensis]|uniref:O-Antigen ligase n=1 Tax=Winogradskyella jejuensis TaxID=1089305 RepID=A0A1M5MVA2_9FLAO|nr:hypothetical protein [Winogradskyella jejuensis]SHG80703.1 hypothetical protein SAMN05444148_0994 [Winogradskyella jejuensis]
MYKEIKGFNILSGFVVALFFFPSITFGTLEAEVFPWGIILSSMLLVRQRKINAYYILFLIILLINVFYSSIIYISDLRIPEVVRSLFAYCNSSLCLVVFYQTSETLTLKTIKLVKKLFIFLLVLGLLQLIGVIGFLDPIFKFLIPRSSSESLSHVSRGVTLLATEPARAGVSLVFFYIVVRAVFIKKNKTFYDIAFFAFLVLVLKSIMALGVYSVFILLVYRIKLIKISIIVIVLAIFADVFGGGGRAQRMLEKIKEQENLADATMVVVDLAGPRLISIYSSWLYSSQKPLGGGIGYWRQTSVEALNMTGVDFSKINYFKFKGNSKAISTRSSGYISNLVLDTGYLGVFVFTLFLYSIFKKFWKNGRESQNIILIFMFKILFIGSVGPPDAWILSIIALKYLDYKSEVKNNSITING